MSHSDTPNNQRPRTDPKRLDRVPINRKNSEIADPEEDPGVAPSEAKRPKLNECDNGVDTLVTAYLRLDFTTTPMMTNLCGVSMMPSSNQQALDYNSGTCFYNDKYCRGYIVNGHCREHEKFFLIQYTIEKSNECQRPIPCSLCKVSNVQTVPIYPLSGAHVDLNVMQYLQHTDPEVIRAAAQIWKGCTVPINSSHTNTTEHTEYTKKLIQFADSHRHQLNAILPHLKNTYIILIFSSSYTPETTQWKEFYAQSKKPKDSNEFRILKIQLHQLNNILDIYTVLRFIPAKCSYSNGEVLAQIPNVVCIDGFIHYGYGFGQSKYVDINEPKEFPNTYKINDNNFLKDIHDYSLRISPMIIEMETRGSGPNPALVVVSNKATHIIKTLPNVPSFNINTTNTPFSSNNLFGNLGTGSALDPSCSDQLRY